MKYRVLLAVMGLVFVFQRCVRANEIKYEVGKSYFSSNKYIEYVPGSLPIIVVSPHGGHLKPDGIPDRKNNPRGNDNKSQEYARGLCEELEKLTGKRPHLIVNHIHTSKFNPVTTKEKATDGNQALDVTFDAFHAFIEVAKITVINRWGKGHYFECHTNGHKDKWIELGYGISRRYLNLKDKEFVEEKPVEQSTLRHLCSGKTGKQCLEIVRGQTSLGGLLESMDYRVVPSPKNPGPGDKEHGYFYAGWNTWKHGSRRAGSVDATHIETHYSYLVKKTVRDKYCKDLAKAVVAFMEKHYGFKLQLNNGAAKSN